ncbi:PLD nuclease N-terminal domain-containing protein [Arthrobacter sp. UYEF20]|uniref:PLD nuclease N-terminal domain-containing protein n=1 Tax=Arthrobacter sp. UYEF20 TaxID=1756363 RepID=UPI003394565E
MLRVVVAVAVLVVFVYGLIDVIRTDSRQTRGISKPAWIVVQIVLPVIGAILWFLIGRPRGTGPAPVTYSHPIAPDDDPDFLRNLEIRRRNQAESDRLKKLKDELDAKGRKLDGGGSPGEGQGSESGETHGSGDAGTQGTDEVK